MKHKVWLAALTTIFVGSFCFVLMTRVFSAPGDLDTTFNGTGFARLGFGQGADQGNAVAAQADGKIVVVGSTTGQSTNLAALRYNSDGSLDTSFGGLGTGQIRNQTSPFPAVGRAVRIQTDGKIVIAGSAFPGPDSSFALVRLKSDGTFDDTFGGNSGGVKTKILSDKSEAFALAIQPDGKIVVAGYDISGQGREIFAVVRYNGDGSLDNSFGINQNGIVTLSLGSTQDRASAVLIQGDGKILLAGSLSNGTARDFALVRYDSNGSLDSSFGSGGIVLTDFGGASSDDTASAVVIQAGTPTIPDTIVVAGTTLNLANGNSDFAVARYSLAGTLDATFGNGGQVTISVDVHDTGAALAIQSPNSFTRKIIIAGTSADSFNFNNRFSLVRLNADGSLDNSFDSDGKAATVVGPGSQGHALALQAGGKLVVAGTTSPVVPSDFAVARFNSDGSLDTSFDGDGKRSDDGDLLALANAVAMQSDDKIVVAGSCLNGAAYDFALARYNPDGSLDTSFDGDGRVITSIGADDFATALAIQTDGKIVVAGYSKSGSDFHFAAVRYNSNGSLDTSFATTGKVVTPVGASDFASSVAIQSDGKILVGGALGAPDHGFVLVRYNSNGLLDNSFGSGGIVKTFVGNSEATSAIAVQPNGRILLFGSSTVNNNTQFTTMRYATNGLLDPSFAETGIVRTPVGGSGNAMVLQTDGRILVGGSAVGGGVALARYNTDGSLDTSFDGDGTVALALASSMNNVTALAIQSDGRILAAGLRSTPITSFDFATMRFNSNGSMDTSYGTNGRVIVDLGNRAIDTAAGIAVDSSGRAVVVGTANDFFMTMRLNGGSVATPTLQFSSASYSVNENAGAVTITVTRTGDSSVATAINYAAMNGTATAGSDYTATSGTLSFAIGDTSKTFSIPILNDSLNEPNETINLALSNVAGNALLGTPNTAVLTIVDDDSPPNISINDVAVAEGNAGPTSAIFNVSLSAASGQTVSVNFATANGSATAGSDYVAASGTLTFNPGQTAKSISVTVNGDTTNEPDETFFVNLSTPTNATIARSKGTGTILNDDGATLTLLIEEGTTNQAAALDSVTQTRGPFSKIDLFNFSSDQRTRLVLFTTNLGQSNSTGLSVQIGGVSVPIENVGPVPGQPQFSQIVVRLDPSVPTGTLNVTVTLNSVTSNTATVDIIP